MQHSSSWQPVLLALSLFALAAPATANDFSAGEYQRQTIYHSPQKPGYTCWVGAWIMPDGDLMTCFTQATGPIEGRPKAPKEVMDLLSWYPQYDMTGLDLVNVHLRSSDAGKTWQQVSADPFKTCMNGVTGEAQSVLPDGTIVRGVFGLYLPYDKDLPKTGFLQRSTDGTKTWGKPEVFLDPEQFTAWPRRIRTLRDGRVLLLVGVSPLPAGKHTRKEFSSRLVPMILISSDKGRTWSKPLRAVPEDQRTGWTEEFDVAELENGDLLTIYRRENDAKRWQGVLKKADGTWIPGKVGPTVLPHSGQPELLKTREGPVLHIATSGIHWTSDAGQNWNKLNVPGTAYYPRSVQSKDGRVFVFGHVGGDDAYGKRDQSIVMDSFRLVAADIAVTNRKSLPTDKLPCERIPLGEADDYKPCIAQLPSGELLLTAFHQHKREGNKVLEQTLLFRSKDGGKSWSKAEKLDLFGREPYLTVLKDGTIFITGHLLANDVRNKWGYTCGFLHRSTDGGKTWESIRIESEGIKPKASNHTTRNVLQLADSTLLLGVDYDGGDGPYLMWRSKDDGKTWDKTGKCQPRDFKSQYGFFGGETWLWQAKSGKIWALVRVDSNELPFKDKPIKARNDQADHFILFSSKDEGKTFDRIRDFGDYGEMYVSLLRLQDKRLLLTFTVRNLKPPLGVRAIVGMETEDGFEFDFTNDRIMLDTRTPVGKYQGGGFGPTVQLKDGTLVTSYSYRGEDDKTHLEVVRWKLPPTQSTGQESFLKPGVRQLFLDDEGIEKIDGLKRVVNQPTRHAKNPVVQGDNPWEKASTSVYGTMLYDEKAKLFRLWYLCTPEPPKDGRKWVEVGGYRRVTNCTLLAYATSKDGVKWEKPVLNQLNFEGSKKNNLIDIGIDNPEGVGVLFAPHEKDPARRYVAFFWDRRLSPPDDKTGVDEALAKVPKEPPGLTDKQRQGGTWVAFSPDGVKWKTHGPVLPQGSDTTHTILYDAKIGKYVAYGRMGFGRTVGRTESADALTWSAPKLVLACDDKDGPGGQIYGMPTDLYEGLYLGMFWMYREGTNARIDTQLAVSRDGVKWSRVADRQTFLPNAKEGSWDDGMSRVGRGINVVGDTIYLHYSMVNGPHRSSKFPKPERKYPGAIGLVTLRRDGFVSLDAGEKAGTMLTKPFVLPVGELHVNAATKDGSLRIAVCDEKGEPIKGFEASREIRADKTAIPVSWPDKLERLRGQTVRLRFTLEKGKLYSFWIGDR